MNDFAGMLTAEQRQSLETKIGTMYAIKAGDPITLPQTPLITGDVDGDKDVDFDNFFAFAVGFGFKSGNPDFNGKLDFDRSGEVDFTDFFIFASQFGKKRYYIR